MFTCVSTNFTCSYVDLDVRTYYIISVCATYLLKYWTVEFCITKSRQFPMFLTILEFCQDSMIMLLLSRHPVRYNNAGLSSAPFPRKLEADHPWGFFFLRECVSEGRQVRGGPAHLLLESIPYCFANLWNTQRSWWRLGQQQRWQPRTMSSYDRYVFMLVIARVS